MSFEDNEEAREKRLEEHIERVVRHAVANAIQPYVRQIKNLQDDAARAAATVKADAERTKELAKEDRERLAVQVKETSEKQAKEVAKEVVNAFMVSLGLDPDKPGDFVRDMMFLRELRETFGTAKRHAILVFIGIMVAGVAAAVWAYVKAGGAK